MKTRRRFKNDRERLRFSKALVERRRAFTGTTAEFCQREGVSVASFHIWKKLVQVEEQGNVKSTASDCLADEKKSFESNRTKENLFLSGFAKVVVQDPIAGCSAKAQNMPDPSWVAKFVLALWEQQI